MTHDELRDELARAMGYRHTVSSRVARPEWHTPDMAPYFDLDGHLAHPVPNTADDALAAFERLCPGAVWGKRDIPWTTGMMEYWACVFGEKPVYTPDTGNFAHDLCALTLAAVRAKGGKADGK